MNTVEELCRLLCAAAGIIRQQAALLDMHGISTTDGALEENRAEILESIHMMAGGDENRCVICGRIIPEGRQVCPVCEKGAAERVDADNLPPILHRIGLFQKRHKANAERRAGAQHRGK